MSKLELIFIPDTNSSELFSVYQPNSSIKQIILAVIACSGTIGDLPWTHVIHSGAIKADSNDLGSVSYSVGVGVLFTFSGISIFRS